MNRIIRLILLVLSAFIPTSGFGAETAFKNLRVESTLNLQTITNADDVRLRLQVRPGIEVQAQSSLLQSWVNGGGVPWSGGVIGKPTTLAGYGITDAQALDADLTSIAALTTTTFGRDFLTLSNVTGAQAKLSLTPGIDIQPYSSTLAFLASNGPGVLLLGNINLTLAGVGTTPLPAANLTGTIASARLAANLAALADNTASALSIGNVSPTFGALTASSLTTSGTLSAITTTGPHKLYVTGSTFFDNVLAVKNDSGNVNAVAGNLTVDPSTDIFTLTSHGLSQNSLVRITSTGAMPGGVTSGADYFARDVTLNTFKITPRYSMTAVDVSSAGTGTLSLSRPNYGYSAINLYAAKDAPPGRATILVNTASPLHHGDMVLSTNPENLVTGTEPPPSIGMGVERNDGGGTYYHHRMLYLDGPNKVTTLYSYQNNAPIGAAAITVLTDNAGVALNTVTPNAPNWCNVEIGGGLSGIGLQDRSVAGNNAPIWYDAYKLIFASTTNNVGNSFTGVIMDHSNAGALYPGNDFTYLLGRSGNRWRGLYTYNADVAGTIVATGGISGASLTTSGAISAGGLITASSGITTSGAVKIGASSTSFSTLQIKTATLGAGGLVDVADTSITANTRIVGLTSQSSTATGALRVESKTPGTGFRIRSLNSSDLGLVAYIQSEP